MIKNLKFFIIIFVIIFITGLNTIKTPLVNAQPDENIHYFFPLFVNKDPNYANFSSIGPDGGTVASVVIDPVDSTTLYAASWGSGVYKSINGAQSWEQKSEGLPWGFIYNIAINPGNRSHIIAAVYRFGVYHSYDAGQTWSPTSGMPAGTVVYSIRFDPANPSNVYAAVRLKTVFNPDLQYPGGVFRSSDGGRTWVMKSSGLTGDYVYDVAIDPRYPNVLFAAMHRDGVFKSTDRGENWTDVNFNIHYRDIRSVFVNPENSDVYAGMWDGKGAALLQHGSNTWLQLQSAVTKNLYVYQLQLDPNQQNTLYLSTSTGLYRCIGYPYPTSVSSCDLFGPANTFTLDLALDRQSSVPGMRVNKMYSGLLNLGVQKTVDAGTSFVSRYTGIKSNVILSILNDPSDPSVLYTSLLGRGVFKSYNEGETWSPYNNGLTSKMVNQLVFRPGDSRVLYAGTQSEGIFISLDSGSSWAAVNTGLSRSGDALGEDDSQEFLSVFDHPPAYSWMDSADLDEMKKAAADPVQMMDSINYPAILTISIDPLNPSRMIAGTQGFGIVKSDDGGLNWQKTNLISGDVYDSLVDRTQPLYHYIAGVSDNGIRVSDSSRTSWLVRNNELHTGADVYGLAVAGPGTYFAASNNGIYMTINAGISWLPTGLSGIRFNDVLIHALSPRTIWAASSDGLYRSLDGGQQWYRLGRQNLNDQFLTIAEGYGSYAVYFGMSGGNIYRLEP